jgi:hypothetical protein
MIERTPTMLKTNSKHKHAGRRAITIILRFAEAEAEASQEEGLGGSCTPLRPVPCCGQIQKICG